MNRTFVDTSFVVALVNPQDQHHSQATKFADLLDGYPILTTEAVLLEIGNALARRFKAQGVEIIDYFLTSAEVKVVFLNPLLFQEAWQLYQTHQDKSWGLVDCISFVVMREHNVVEALTNDKDFQQAGFKPLLRELEK